MNRRRSKASSSIFLTLCLVFSTLFNHVFATSSSSSNSIETTLTVYGVVGGKAALPCNITSPTVDDAVSLILWYKEESSTPIYSLDARKGNLDQARHASRLPRHSLLLFDFEEGCTPFDRELD